MSAPSGQKKATVETERISFDRKMVRNLQQALCLIFLYVLLVIMHKE